jgi:hypothetical protein
MKSFWYVFLIAFVVALIAFPLAAISLWIITMLLDAVGFWYTVGISTTMCCLRVILDERIWKEFS